MNLNEQHASLTVVIPAHNEASSLPFLCDALSRRGIRIIVVDDGSTDETRFVAERHGADVLRHDSRRGKGAAIRSGLARALSGSSHWIATMDADGQHRPEDLDRLLEAACSTGADLVFGERRFSEDMPRARRWTNWTMSWILRRLTGLPIRDSQCGLKIISAASARRMPFVSSHFEIESEIILTAAREHMTIKTVPISTIYLPGRRSRITAWTDALRWFWLIAKALRNFGLKPPASAPAFLSGE